MRGSCYSWTEQTKNMRHPETETQITFSCELSFKDDRGVLCQRFISKCFAFTDERNPEKF